MAVTSLGPLSPTPTFAAASSPSLASSLTGAVSSAISAVSQLIGSTPSQPTVYSSTGFNIYTNTPNTGPSVSYFWTTQYTGGTGPGGNIFLANPGNGTYGSIFGLPGNYSDPLILTAIAIGILLALLFLGLLLWLCCRCCCGLPTCCYAGAGPCCGTCCDGTCCGTPCCGASCCGCVCYGCGCEPGCGNQCCAPARPVHLVTRKCIQPQVLTSCVNEQAVILQPTFPRGRVTAVKSIDCAPPMTQQMCQPMNLTIRPIVGAQPAPAQSYVRPISNYQQQPAVIDLYTVPIREHHTRRFTYETGGDDNFIDTSRSHQGGSNGGCATIIFNDRPSNGNHGYAW